MRFSANPDDDFRTPEQLEIAALRDALRRKDVLIEKLHVVAKNVSHALMSFTPGGSEYFTSVKVDDFEGYYADADVCQRRIRERITSAEERARDEFRASLSRVQCEDGE